jgi:hypothetical protein
MKISTPIVIALLVLASCASSVYAKGGSSRGSASRSGSRRTNSGGSDDYSRAMSTKPPLSFSNQAAGTFLDVAGGSVALLGTAGFAHHFVEGVSAGLRQDSTFCKFHACQALKCAAVGSCGLLMRHMGSQIGSWRKRR